MCYVMFNYLLDVHAFILSMPCLFPKDIGGALHVTKVLHFAFKRKFNQVYTLWGSLLNIFHGNNFISLS